MGAELVIEEKVRPALRTAEDQLIVVGLQPPGRSGGRLSRRGHPTPGLRDSIDQEMMIALLAPYFPTRVDPENVVSNAAGGTELDLPLQIGLQGDHLIDGEHPIGEKEPVEREEPPLPDDRIEFLQVELHDSLVQETPREGLLTEFDVSP